MGECASPYPVGFLRLDSVGETLNLQRAFIAERFGNTDGILPRLLLGEVLGKENVGDVLTGCPTVSFDSVRKGAVGLMSVVTHNLILEEDTDGS